MRISAKGRYGIAAMICLGKEYASGKHVAAIAIAEELGISKIYLEQVFTLLKKGGLVTSTKGAHGGYTLSRDAKDINLYDILEAIETSLFEETKPTLETSKSIESAMIKAVFKPLDNAVKDNLSLIDLESLIKEVELEEGNDYMFYI